MPTLAVAMMTHTTRHLRRSLLGVAHQSRRPDRVVVSCDTDDPAIATLVREASAEFRLPISLVQRPHLGHPRLNQVRNNALRALIADAIDPAARIVAFDGDCCPAFDCLEAHERLGAGRDLVVAFRVELSALETETFDEDAVRAGRPPATVRAESRFALDARHRRYARQLWLKRFGLTKTHKPKILGAHFSATLDILRRVNGFDEEYTGYGADDDDFSRRVYAVGGRPAIAVKDAVVYHQWHPTRAPGSWDEASGVARFKMNLPARCARGLDNPLDQPTPTVRRFEGGQLVRESELPAAPLVTGDTAL